MKTKMKKFFAMLLALCIIMGQISMNAFAAGTDGEGGTTTETEKVMVNGDKTATDLDENFNSDVTLKIPGEVEQLGVDIVYIVGSFATDDDGNPNVEGDMLISSLVDTMTEIVEAGTPVNFGMVPFSSDNVVAMELTAITSENLAQLPDMITEALATCESLYDGVNMENALIKSKKMLSESALASRPDRQHLVLVSSGFTYFFNSDDKETGEKNKYVSLVPVRISNGGNNLYYMNKGWMQARTGQGNTYPLPKAFSKYNDYRDWELYWSYIDQWARTDIAAGDEVVYEAIDVEVGDFLTWYSSGAGSSSGNGKYIKGVSAEDAVKYPYATRLDNYKVKNPLDEPSAQHAILYERAMWEAYEYVKENIVNAGINFYPIYNELQHAYTNGVSCNNELNDNGKRYDYKIDWTTQYIGHSFMNMLAGGEAVLYNSKSDKTFFDPIKAEILYCVSAGSTVTDYIGYDADEKEGYNFDFVLGAENLKLTVGDEVYSVAEVESAEGVTATYEFTAPDGETATFKLEYYYGTGTDDEYFVWTLNENISKYRQVSLTYKVNLVEKSEVPGTHVAHTNIEAYLEPVDSEGKKGEKKYFPDPTVEYEVEQLGTLTFTKLFYGANTPLKGVGFTLYDAEGNKVGNEVLSDENGVVTFANLASGVYTVKETKAPTGVYPLDPVTIKVANGKVTDVDGGELPGVFYNVLKPLEGDKKTDPNKDGSFNVEVNINGKNGAKLHDEVIIMMDGSYSGDDEWLAAKAAIVKIGDMVLNSAGNTQLTLMAFGMADNIVLEHVTSVTELESALGVLPGTLLYGRSSTNCEAGMTGVQEYIEAHDDKLNDAYVIYISDGEINTDETPRDFIGNWQKFATKFGALTVAQATLEGECVYGENKSKVFTEMFGERFAAAEDLNAFFNGVYAAEGGVSNEMFLEYADRVWNDVYKSAGLEVGVEYPVSTVERAFVTYDKTNGTYIQDVFYYTTYKSSYVTYPDRWTRTPQAATELAAMDEVAHLYMIDTNGRSSWMDPANSADSTKNIVGNNVSFTANAGVGTLANDLENILTELAKTPYGDVVITDYMSKWVNLDTATIAIVDKASGSPVTIWNNVDGWLIDVADRPTQQEVPVKIEVVPVSEYPAGGPEVIGNASGDIIKLTWYVKDGTLMRSDNFSLVYNVTLDMAEGIVPGVNYPTNGLTAVSFMDFTGHIWNREILVPVAETKAYTVTVNYYDVESGEVISEQFIHKDFENEAYDVIVKDAIEIEGYTYVRTEGDALSGILDQDKVINVYYEKLPEVSSTEESTEEETEDFEDETDVPLGDKPVVDETPETGDARFAWLLAMVISGLSLAALPILKKER